MIFVLGGFAQGKTKYVQENWQRFLQEKQKLQEQEQQQQEPKPQEQKPQEPKLQVQETFCLLDGMLIGLEELSNAQFNQNQVLVINHLHGLIKPHPENRDLVYQQLLVLDEKVAELILIGDEIGNGLIPMDAGERAYREETGRLYCAVAAQARSVIRMVCGLPQVLK